MDRKIDEMSVKNEQNIPWARLDEVDKYPNMYLRISNFQDGLTKKIQKDCETNARFNLTKKSIRRSTKMAKIRTFDSFQIRFAIQRK